MTRAVTISSTAGTLALGAASGVRAGLRIRGTGLPPVDLQMFESAGDGARMRGARVLSRKIDMPFKITGETRDVVWQRYSTLATIVAPDALDVKIAIELDGETWYALARRSGGGDFTWGEDTDGKTMILTTITFVAGNPYWLRDDQESMIITPGGLGRGLLTGAGALSGLEVSSTTALGFVTFSNTGDLDAFPTWRLTGPLSGFTLTSFDGKTLEWVGDLDEGDQIVVDTEFGTVVDGADSSINLYGGLQGAPRFWRIPKGTSDAEVVVADAVSDETQIEVFWRPRKWMVF